jgi:flagellar basal body rod protein FlgC
MVRKSVNLTQETIDLVNSYRKAQANLPNFSQALNQIVEAHLKVGE